MRVLLLFFEHELNELNELNKRNYGSNRLCNCDGMDERLPHKEKEAHEERAANNE